MTTDKYIRNIIIVILLMDIPAVVLLYYFPKQSLGWILGSIGSIGNMIWLAKSVKKNLMQPEKKAQIGSLKNFYFRYPALILYSVAIVYFLKPNIMIFGLGLLSGQIAIYVYEIYQNTRDNG